MQRLQLILKISLLVARCPGQCLTQAKFTTPTKKTALARATEIHRSCRQSHLGRILHAPSQARSHTRSSRSGSTFLFPDSESIQVLPQVDSKLLKTHHQPGIQAISRQANDPRRCSTQTSATQHSARYGELTPPTPTLGTYNRPQIAT